MTNDPTIQRIEAFGGKGLPCGGPAAVRVGNHLFLSARFGADLEDGGIATSDRQLPADVRARYAGERYIDDMEWPITAQTWWIYEAFSRILSKHGATLQNLVRTNTYFRDLQEFPAMERARAPILPVDPPPSTVLQVPFGALPDEARVYIEGVAVVPQAGLREAIRSRLGAGAHYAWGVRIGDAAWVSGQTPGHPLRGVFVDALADLGPEGAALATGNIHLDQREGPITAQTWTVYWRIKTILEDGGFSPGDITQEKIYLRHIQHLAAVERARRRFYQQAEAAPPTYYLAVNDLGRTANGLLEIDVLAARGRRLLPGEPDGCRRWGGAATASGPFLILGGFTARDPKTGRVPRSAGDLRTRGTTLPRGAGEGLGAHALAAYDRLDAFLASQGSSLGRLAKAEIYVKDAPDLTALDAVHKVVFPNGAPALSIVPMTWVDHDPNVTVKIGGIALGPGE